MNSKITTPILLILHVAVIPHRFWHYDAYNEVKLASIPCRCRKINSSNVMLREFFLKKPKFCSFSAHSIGCPRKVYMLSFLLTQMKGSKGAEILH